MTLLSMLDRFEQAAVTYETSTAKADRDELHAARRAIMEAFEAKAAGEPVAFQWRKVDRLMMHEEVWSFVDYHTGLKIKEHPEKYEVRALGVIGEASQPSPAHGWPEPTVLNTDIPAPTGEPYLDSLLHRLLDAQQDINVAANTYMDQSLCDASALLDEVETTIRKLALPAQITPAAGSREAELVKALEPFAKAANPYDGVKSNGALWGDDGLTIGHLRAARAAIHPSLEQE